MKTITLDGIEYQLTPIPTEAPKAVQWEPNRVGICGSYYVIDYEGEIDTSIDRRDQIDKQRAAFGNYFHTEQEAKEAAKQVRQLLRLRAYVREFAPNYKPDWNNDLEIKWFIQFDERHGTWGCSYVRSLRDTITVYMPQTVASKLVRKLNSGEVVL